MFRLRAFGGLTLERDGAPYSGPATQRRRLALLAVLAAAPDTGTSRDRVADYIWPDADPNRGRHSLDDALSALRREIGTQALFLAGAGLRLNSEVLTSDVADYSTALRLGDAERAVSLYSGPFLDGFYLPRAGEFERWVEAERSRRAATHARALEGLATAAAERGDNATAVRWWKARVDADPLDTPATLRLLMALVTAGNPAEALRLARVHETLVREELDIAPGQEWEATVQRLRHDLARAPIPVIGIGIGTPAAPVPSITVNSTMSDRTGQSDQSNRSRPIAAELEPPAEPSAEPQPEGSLPEVSKTAALPQWSHARVSRRAIAGAGAIVLACVLAGLIWQRRSYGTERSPHGEIVAQRVLVVPFENATGDSALAPLGRMAADWVAEGLAQVNNVKVTADLATHIRVGDAGLRAAAMENDAGTVVSGTYYYDGDSVRLQARVTDVATWTLLRTVAPVTASRATPTVLLEPLRQRVMAVLAVIHDQRFAAFGAGAPPPSYEAYEQYLAGTALFEQGDWLGALPYYARAAALDSSYVQPLLATADGYMNLSRFASADTIVRLLERRRQALTPADRGSLDRLRGSLDGDRMAELAGARATATAAPGAQLPQFLHAATALRAGLPHEALVAAAPIASSFGRVRTDWTGSIYWSTVTTAHHLMHDYAAERVATRTGRAYHPDSPDLRAYELRALAALGRLDTLRRGLAELEAMPPTSGATPLPELLIFVAQELDAHGYPNDARSALRQAVIADRARSAAARQLPTARYELARVLYLLGEYNAAAPLFAKLAIEQPGDPRYIGYQGLVAVHRGRHSEAERVAERLRTLRRPYDRGQTAYARARLAAALGDQTAAITLIRQALSEGMAYGTSLHVDPDLAPLRGDSAFQAFLRPRG